MQDQLAAAAVVKNDGIMHLESHSTLHQHLSPDDHMVINNKSKKSKNKAVAAEVTAVQQRMYADDSFKQKHLRVPKVKTSSKAGTKKRQPVINE